MTDFRMPSLGADMEAGTLVEWLKKPGDRLERGDIIAVVETQKGAIEIEVFDAGILDTTLTRPGEKVPVGQTIATIRRPGEPAGGMPSAPERWPQGPALPAATKLQPQPPKQPAHPGDASAKVTPAARRLATRHGIDLTKVQPDASGVIGLAEIENAVATSAAVAPSGRAPTDMRKAIAAAMSRSSREIPHYYVSLEIDVTPMTAWLTARNASRSAAERVLYAAPLLRAVALALRKFPDLNGTYENDSFVPSSRINVGVAVAKRGGGLITPAILDTDQHNIDTLMQMLNDAVRRVRTGGLRSSELSMGTVTLTNLGEQTADSIMPIIYPPQVAIVGCGQIRRRAWVLDGEIVPRDIMVVTVGGDHRVSDGRTGARYLAHLSALLSEPEAL